MCSISYFKRSIFDQRAQMEGIQQTFVGLQDVLKTSSKHVLKTSSARPQRNNFSSSKTSWRHLEDISQDVFKTSSRRLYDVLEDEILLRWIRLQDVLKTCLEDVLKTCLEDIIKTSWRQTKCLLGIIVSNKSKCVSNKSIFSKFTSGKSKANPKLLIRTK